MLAVDVLVAVDVGAALVVGPLVCAAAICSTSPCVIILTFSGFVHTVSRVRAL